MTILSKAVDALSKGDELKGIAKVLDVVVNSDVRLDVIF